MRKGHSGGYELHIGDDDLQHGKLNVQSMHTHQRNSQTNVVKAIPVDHIATASICSLRFRGTSAGTKLYGNEVSVYASAPLTMICGDALDFGSDILEGRGGYGR